MTEQEKQKLNEKLAEWVGFYFQKLSDLQPKYRHEGNQAWVYPAGEINRQLPRFTDSLDACFKWLVPKLYELGFDYSLTGYTYHVATIRKESLLYSDTGHRTLALALCLVIEKLIDEEAK